MYFVFETYNFIIKMKARSSDRNHVKIDTYANMHRIKDPSILYHP